MGQTAGWPVALTCRPGHLDSKEKFVRLAELGLTLADLDLGGIDAESDPRLEEYFVTTPYVQNAFSGRRTLFWVAKGVESQLSSVSYPDLWQ